MMSKAESEEKAEKDAICYPPRASWKTWYTPEEDDAPENDVSDFVQCSAISTSDKGTLT